MVVRVGVALLLVACGSPPSTGTVEVKDPQARAVAVAVPVTPPAPTAPPTPPTPPPETGSAKLRRVAPVLSMQERLTRLFDESGWDWRAAGVAVRLGYHPNRCCHWGVYDVPNRTIWIGRSAFRNPRRLRYTALHELAHAWQWASGRLEVLQSDMHPWGRRGVAALEAGADCIAQVWGAPPGHYWQCPSDAQRNVARRLDADWD